MVFPILLSPKRVIIRALFCIDSKISNLVDKLVIFGCFSSRNNQDLLLAYVYYNMILMSLPPSKCENSFFFFFCLFKNTRNEEKILF